MVCQALRNRRELWRAWMGCRRYLLAGNSDVHGWVISCQMVSIVEAVRETELCLGSIACWEPPYKPCGPAIWLYINPSKRVMRPNINSWGHTSRFTDRLILNSKHTHTQENTQQWIYLKSVHFVKANNGENCALVSAQLTPLTVRALDVARINTRLPKKCF